MTISDDIIDHLEKQIPELSGSAVTAAYWRTLASGFSVLKAEHGAIYEVFLDGSRRLVKQIEPPTPVECGKKISIR